MIISYRHRFVFVKSKKTAGSSIEIALSRICGPDDVITGLPPKDEVIRSETGGRPEQNHVDVPGRRNVYQHSPALVARLAVGKEHWGDFFTFAVERNPWDAVVSLFHWVGRRRPELEFESFVHGPETANLVKHNFAAWHIHGAVAVDRVLRYERLDEELAQVWEELHLPGEPDLPRAKGGLRPAGHYRDYYSPETRDLVGELFATQIGELGYEF